MHGGNAVKENILNTTVNKTGSSDGDGITLTVVPYTHTPWYRRMMNWLLGPVLSNISDGLNLVYISSHAEDAPVERQPVPEVDGVKIFPFGYRHEACGKIAFYMDYKPAHGSVAHSKGVYHLDGRPMEFGSERVCEACGEHLKWNAPSDRVVPLVHFSETMDPTNWSPKDVGAMDVCGGQPKSE